EVQLNGAALPGPADGVLQMEVNLGAVESAIPLVYRVGQAQVIQGSPEGISSQFPVLIASHRILGTGGKLHMILKAEKAVYLINEPGHTLDLIPDLIRGHKDVGVVLSKAADSHEAVELPGFLMAVDNAQLAQPQRQIPVRA